MPLDPPGPFANTNPLLVGYLNGIVDLLEGRMTDQAVVIGSATGGAQGSGTLNAVNLYVNGVAVTTGGLTNPMTTTGDAIYSSDNSGTPTRLPVGTGVSPVLGVSGGIPAWVQLDTLVLPCCRVYKSAAQSINSGAATAITFDTERYDTDTMHSTVSNTTRITFTTAGVYSVGASIEFAASAVGNTRVLAIKLNGTTFIAFEQEAPVPGGLGSTNMTTETEYKFAAADYVEFIVQQDSGGPLNIDSAGNYTPEAWASFQSA